MSLSCSSLFWLWAILSMSVVLIVANGDIPSDKTPDSCPSMVQGPSVRQLVKIGKNNPRLISDIIKVFNSELGYALIGVKPVSFYEEGSSVNQQLLVVLKDEFSASDEIIFKVTNKSGRQKEICIIHKKSFLRCARENQELRNFIVKEFSSIENFFHCFEKSSLPLCSFCKCNGKILGTMLGFGAKNAENWSRLSRLDQFLGASNIERLSSDLDPGMIALPAFSVTIPYALTSPVPNQNFSSIFDEWKLLEKGKRWTEGFTPPYCIYLPEFVFWSEQEDAMQRFIQARDTLGMIFSEIMSTK